MQKPPPFLITYRLRARYALAGVMMLGLWVVTLVPLFRDDGGFKFILAAITTFTLFPLGIVALLGGVHGSEAGMRRAQIALFTAGASLMLILFVEMLRRAFFAAGS